MGRELATVALAIVSAKEAGQFRTTPSGYFHGLVAKAAAGELYLERTIWPTRRPAQPQPERRGAYRCDHGRSLWP